MDMGAPETGPGRRSAGAAATQELKPFHTRAGGGLAAAEQDGAHLRGRGRRGHAGGVIRRCASLSALLPGRGAARIGGVTCRADLPKPPLYRRVSIGKLS